MCISYRATLKLMDNLSKTHSVPLKKWTEEKVVFKFWGDNLDKLRHVCELRSDNSGEMVHMFSILVGRSRTPAPELPHGLGNPSLLDGLCSKHFLPSSDDFIAIKENLIKLLANYSPNIFFGLLLWTSISQNTFFIITPEKWPKSLRCMLLMF